MSKKKGLLDGLWIFLQPFRSRLSFFPLFLALFLGFGGRLGASVPRPAVLAMSHPTLRNIQNIQEIWERDFLNLPRLTLLCLYHESDALEFAPARDFVRDQKLKWVHFQEIRGQVALAHVYGENAWSTQFREIFKHSDGLLLNGGEDLPPGLYGAATSLHSEPATPQRSYWEASLLFHLLGGSQKPDWVPYLKERPAYPVLGICLGAQTLNAATGGTLIQDIPSQVYGLSTLEQVLELGTEHIHSPRYRQQLAAPGEDNLPQMHSVQILPGSRLEVIGGLGQDQRPRVLSYHHQAIDKLGWQLLVCARSLDGRIVEAVEHKQFTNVFGVQFHPESQALYRKGLEYTQAGKVISLRFQAQSDPPTWSFHQRLWAWLAQALKPSVSIPNR